MTRSGTVRTDILAKSCLQPAGNTFRHIGTRHIKTMTSVIRIIFQFIKKETILTISWVAAMVSSFFVPPGPEYLRYIDFRSLGILWSLMIVMEGLKKIGFFSHIGERLLKRTHKVWQLVTVLVMLCFFFSMLITNDVALITFVPFTIYILAQIDMTYLLIPVIVLQTLAANLGSMLTPVGNPQNLYLYGISGMSFASFIRLMAPYTGLTLILLLLSICFIKGKGNDIPVNPLKQQPHADPHKITNVSIYGALFLFALLVVLRILPFWILCIIVLITVFVIDKKVLVSIDYALLFTFIGFFIFTGNLGNIPSVSAFLTNMIAGREVVTAVAASQIISNVPAALLLSGFTDDYASLIIGVNLGGLGTLIASMASLISFKSLAHNFNAKKGWYFLDFTLMNLLYLAILLGLWFVIG